jgi:hypothetical protein
MKSIKIVKQKRDESAASPPTENKPVTPGTNHIASTVKNWIAESKERKRNQRRSFPVLTIVLVMTFVLVALGTPIRKTKRVSQTPGTVMQTALETNDRALTPEERAIRVTIASVSSFLGPPTNHYRVGDQIPITITMTNTSPSTVYTCLSSDIYQDVPKLTRDGQVVPYMNWQSYERLNAQRDNACHNEDENIKEPVILRPNEPQMADWFVLADSDISSGADAWYDPLPAGEYELSIQRRLACCEGPMVQSNTISFEVVR